MALHELRDVGEAIEKLRRLRKDLPQGEAQAAVDRQLLRMAEHLEGIVGDDERLRERRQLRQEAMDACPVPGSLGLLEIQGKVGTVLDLMLKGATAASAWQRVLK